MADDNKSISERKALLQSEYDIQQMLIAAQKTRLSLSNKGFDIQRSLVDELQSQSTATDKIESVNNAIDQLLKEQIKSGKKINQHYIDKLDNVRKILVEEEKQDKIIEAQNKMLETRKGILNSILGIESDLEEAILNGTLKALMLQTAFDNVSANANRMVDGLKEGVTQMGLSVGQSFQLQGNIEQARFSLTGVLYGTEAVAASAKAITEEYGSAGAATSDMIKGVTQLSSITGDAASATQLAKVFEQAGVNATDVRDTIEDIAKSKGISAKKAMEGMTDQMDKLVGKSKEELETIIASNAQLVKQGTNMTQIEDISNNMLSVETSMRAEAKARAFLGRDINANAVRTASLELQTATTDEARAIAQEKISQAVLTGVGGMGDFNKLSNKQKQLLAESYGLNSTDLATMMQKKQTQDELTAKYGEYADLVEGTIGLGKMLGSTLADAGIEMAKLIAKTTVLNLLQGKGTGLVNPFNKKGGTTTPATPSISPDGGKGMSGMTGAIEKIDAKKLLAGGAALVLVAASVFIFAKAVQEFMKVSWEAVGMAVVSMLALVGAVTLLGVIMTSGMIGPVLAGAAAMVVIAGAMYIMGAATQQFIPIVETLGDIFIGVLGMIPPIIDSIATGFATMFSSVSMDNIGPLLLLGPALYGIGLGLAAIGYMGFPGLLVLTGLAAIAPTLLSVAQGVSGLFGGTDSESDTANSDSKVDTMKELLTEIKGLRSDLQAQPIVLNVDGKVVSKISRVQSRQNVSKQGYGG